MGKEQFLMFRKVLMKYLKQKDQSMHACAKEVIRDCAKKNKEGNPAYSCLSISMQSHLKQLVGGIVLEEGREMLTILSSCPICEERRASRRGKEESECNGTICSIIFGTGCDCSTEYD